MASSLEQRKFVRYHGEIQLELKQGTGLTRDFSTDGIFFVTDQPVSMGEQLELVMLLEHQNHGKVVRVRCQGEVLRVETGSDSLGVAAAITSHLFEGTPVLT